MDSTQPPTTEQELQRITAAIAEFSAAFAPVFDAITAAWHELCKVYARWAKEIIAWLRVVGWLPPYRHPKRAHRRRHGGRWNKHRRVYA